MGVIDALISLGDRVHGRFGTSVNLVAEHLPIDGGDQVAISRLSRPTAREALPLVIALHGFGSDERQMATLAPLSRARTQVHYVAVRGGWTLTDGGYAWFPIEGPSPSDLTADISHLDEAADRLASVVRELTASPGVNAEGVWIVGYSQGAPMALHVLWRHPDLIRGIAIGAGGFISDPDPAVDLSSTACFVAISTNDPFVSAADHANTVRTLQRAGSVVETCEAAVPHVITSSQADAIDRWLLAQF